MRDPLDAETEILSLAEVARYLRIKQRTLYTLAAQRKIPAVKIGGQWRIQKKQLTALFEERDQEAVASSAAVTP